MKTLFRKWRGLTVACAIAAAPLVAHAVVQVQSLGGGPNETSPARSGFANGPTLANAKFNNPYGVALDTFGNLYIADRDNGKIRRISKPGASESVTTTFAAGLPQPVGVVVDRSNYVYVVTQRDGKLRKFNGNGLLLQTIPGLRAPTALALAADGSVFITELGGTVQKVSVTGVISPITSGLSKPRGITILADGTLAVTESSAHRVTLIDSFTGATTNIAGSSKGFADGDGLNARFNTPHGIVVAPNGALVVADRLNHRVRVIDTNYNVTTLYGIPPSQWSHQLGGFFPGWVDGAGGQDGEASARDVVGLTITTNGTLYSTEGYWDLVRAGTGTGLVPTNAFITVTNINSTNTFIVLPTPAFSPRSGYFPFGVTITVTSAAPVYYTTDATEPTTNSRQVQMIGTVGTLRFGENQRDLGSLRLKALAPNSQSATVGGNSVSSTTFGIPRDFLAGSGATILIPVVANLREDVRIQSLQYRVEITPLNGAPPVLPYLRALSILTNDFIPLATMAAATKIAHFSSSPYTIGNTRGLVISASGTNANVDFQHFATTTLLAVPIDANAVEGQSYRVEVLYPSATSDGFQSDVTVATGPARTITIRSLPWLVGDVAPGIGYNAGEFGDGNLVNSDANSVLSASVGLRVPFPFSDAFNAMDAYPPEPSASGGDGRLEFADWQIVLDRSLRLDPENWARRWMDGGIVQSDPTTLPASLAQPRKPAKAAPVAPGVVWQRGATLHADNVYNNPSGFCEVPVSLKVAAGSSVGGLCFRVVVESDNGAPAATGLTFAPTLGQSGFQTAAGAAPNDVVCAWSMVPSSPFTPALQGDTEIGRVRFNIPPSAVPGHRYTIRFLRPSGAANLQQTVSFEGIPGSAWVLWTPAGSGERTSDEWRQNFFGSLDEPTGADDADPDNDGVPNWQEYLNGTNPVPLQP